jgi:hypothetical protein
MAKVKNKKIGETRITLNEWSMDGAKVGTPTMVMFPPKNFHFRVSKKEHKITIPRSGNYYKIAPEVFTEEDGDFMVYDEENSVIYLPSITKILFAVGKYPALESNQLFAPIALLINKDTVDIIGQIVEMLPPQLAKSTAV